MRVLATLVLTLLLSTPASAERMPTSHWNAPRSLQDAATAGYQGSLVQTYLPKKKAPRANLRASVRYKDGRPAKWCGWYMRQKLGVADRNYNRARHWLNYGSPTIARVGAVVVWPHHVGIITGRASNGNWIVLSGNDSNRVRERARSVKGAIGFRA